MGSYSDRVAERRRINAKALAAFDQVKTSHCPSIPMREVRSGGDGEVTVFTIGYERRDGSELIAVLRDAGVEVLVDVRERPFSRKADFRRTALEEQCSLAGLIYESWPELGSTEHQRAQLKETGDLGEFHRRFRDFARRGRQDSLERLARLARSKTVALLCYERCHDECHRSVVADLVAKSIDASVVAIQ